jgi:FkbM family methyltransferase
LRRFLRPGMNAIDVGANIGYFTLLMSESVGRQGNVLAIEADPESFSILRANLMLRDAVNVEALPVAVTRTAGLANLSRSGENLGGHKAFYVENATAYLPVQGVRIDDILDPEQSVSLVKVDIEGMDHVAVEGMNEAIRRWRPTFLVEFNPANIEAFGDRPESVLALYRALDLTVAVLGADLILLRDYATFDADSVLRNDLLVDPGMDTALIDGVRRIGLINLLLAPLPG